MNGEVVQSIRLDFSGLSGPQQVCYTQYGQTLPVIEALLCDKGQPYQIPEGAQVSIRLKKPSGTVIYSPAGSWEGNQIRYPLSGQAAAAFGSGTACFEIETDEGVLQSPVFRLEILKNPVQEGDIQDSDEFQTLRDYVDQAKASADTAAEGARQAQASEQAAQASAGQAAQSAQSAGESASSAAQSASSAQADSQAASQSAAAAAAGAQSANESAAQAAQSAAEAKAAADQAQSIGQGAQGYYQDPGSLAQAHPQGQAGWWAIVGSTDTIWVWDTDTGAWVNTHQTTDLSRYYTKEETYSRQGTDAAIEGAIAAAITQALNTEV